MNTLSHINNITISVPTKSADRYVRFELYDEANTLIYVGRVWIAGATSYQTVNITDIVRAYKPIVNDSTISSGSVVRKTLVKKFYVKSYETDGTYIATTEPKEIMLVYPLPTTISQNGRVQFEQFGLTAAQNAGAVPCWQFNKYDLTNWQTQKFDIYPRYPMGSIFQTPKFTLYSPTSRGLLFYQYDENNTEDNSQVMNTSIPAQAYTYSLPTTDVSSTRKQIGIWTSVQGYTTKYRYAPRVAVTFHIEEHNHNAKDISDVMIDYNDKYTKTYVQNTAYQSIYHGIGQQFILNGSSRASLEAAIARIEAAFTEKGMEVLDIETIWADDAEGVLLTDRRYELPLYGWNVDEQERDTMADWVVKAFGIEDKDEALYLVDEWIENDMMTSDYMEVWDEGFEHWHNHATNFPEYQAFEQESAGNEEWYDDYLRGNAIDYSVPNILKVADLDDCPSKYYMQWEDRFGSAFCYPFSGKETRTMSYNRTNIEDQYGASRPAILQNDAVFELNSGWLTDKHMEVFESMMVSPWLALYDTELGLKFDVIVEDKNYVIKTRKNQGKKMYNFSVKLKINTKENIVY